MMLNGGNIQGANEFFPECPWNDDANHTLNVKSAITQRPAHQGLGWGLSGDPANDFPLTSIGSFGHNGAFGAIM